MTWRLAIVLAAGAAGVLAACGGDDGGDAAEATTTTLEPTSTTTTSTTARPSSTTTSTTAPPACPVVPPEVATGDGSALEADVDGDGRADRVSTVPVGDDGTTIRIDLAAGGSAVEAVPPVADHVATVRAAVDLDADPAAELLVEVGRGASTRIVGLFELDGCDLEAVQLDGTDAQFGIGGPVLLLQGLRCEGERLVHLGASSHDGETYDTVDVVYELRDGELIHIDDRSGQLTAGDPALEPYSRLDC